MSAKKLRVAVVGATGYTGAELVRLLLQHPRVELGSLVGHSAAGEPVTKVLPALAGVVGGAIATFDADAIAASVDAAFCALPHGASAPIVKQLRERGVIVFDLSADFRLRDLGVYSEWYGKHGAPELLPHAVYGLPELFREALKSADLIAVPGCYPTASALALIPLVHERLVDPESIVIDAKSGVSGAGRGLSPGTHFSETAEGIRPYKAGGAHRHTPEIEQTLSHVFGRSLRVVFTPHLIPMVRGILVTAYAKPASDVSVEAVRRIASVATRLYEGSPSVVVLDHGSLPDTSWVKGSNRAHVSYVFDERAHRVIAFCAIDNLVKGAAGQAVQCFNIRFGLSEGEGLLGTGIWP